MIAPEAKAIPLIHEMARQSGRNEYLLARKAAKALYGRGVLGEVHLHHHPGQPGTVYGRQRRQKMAGKRVLILDDVISTGESLAAMEHLVKEVERHHCGQDGGAGRGGAAARKDIIYLEKLPLFDGQGTPLG